MKEKSRRKSEISMTRQNSQNSSFGQWHGLVKVVSDETSSDESSFNNSGLGDSLSLPSDGSSLKSCKVEGMSFAMGSKRGSSYVNFDAVPRTPYQEEKSRWSRESRGSLKIQNNSFLKKSNCHCYILPQSKGLQSRFRMAPVSYRTFLPPKTSARLLLRTPKFRKPNMRK